MSLSLFEFSGNDFVSPDRTESEENDWDHALTLSGLGLEDFPSDAFLGENLARVSIIVLSKNALDSVPTRISLCSALKRLDLSKNSLEKLPKELLQLPKLRYMDLGSNLLNEWSLECEEGDNLNFNSRLTHLVLSNNNFGAVPWWVLNLADLVFLQMGANKLKALPSSLCILDKIEDLFLGGNKLSELPDSIGSMHQLKKLILNDNHLTSIPDTFANLLELKSLMLHGNRLKFLPQSLIRLEKLEELSLRGNPLVEQFVKAMHVYHVPTLKELASRLIVNSKLPFLQDEIPNTLLSYLKSSQRCLNPECSGVYFTSCVEHVKFIDFCGRYKVPFLMYLCSPSCDFPEVECSSSSEAESELGVSPMQMRRVLLG